MSKIKTNTTRGFTIVELLIVIVVIGILAAVSIVSYSGIQQRANSTKTVSALDAWIKALTLYKTDNGRWPSGLVCLGEGYSYGVTGADSTGTAQCRQDYAGGGVTVSTSFNAVLSPYIGSQLPTPSFVTTRSTDLVWRRGIIYYYGGGSGNQVYVTATFAGPSTTCPVAGGISGSGALWNGNLTCNYDLGLTTDT